jgi:tetratricopeptide (TPR) repeat protein
VLGACTDAATDPSSDPSLAPSSAAAPASYDDARVTVGAPDDAGVVVAAVVDAGVVDDDLPDTVVAAPLPAPASALPAPSSPRTPPPMASTSSTTGTQAIRPPLAPSARGRKVNVDAALASAQRLYVSGRFADAIALLTPVAKQTPGDARVHRMLGLYNAKLRRIDEARLHLARYLELAPDAPDAARVRAQLDRL